MATVAGIEDTGGRRSRRDQARPRSRWIEPVQVDEAGWFVRHRYALAGGLLTVLVASQTRNQQWTKDIWLHAGVVAELARHPFSPGDPIIGGVGTPNEWLSPYGWLGGAAVRMTGLAPLTVLSGMAVLNTVLLLVALWSFTVTFTGNRRAPFYALLAALALWGPGAWRWSGFVHLDALGYVASYPATFALAVLLLTLVATARLLEPPVAAGATTRPGPSNHQVARAIWVCSGTVLVVLCHPPSAPILVVGLVAVVISRPAPPPLPTVAVLVAALLVACGVVLAWPWYSVLHLDQTGEIRAPMSILYERPIPRIAPVLVGLPVIALRSRAFPRDVLGLLLLGATLLYVGGAISGHDELGRSVAAAALVAQVALGDGLGRLEARWVTDHDLPPGGWLLAGASVVALVLGSFWLRAGVVRMVPHELWPASVDAASALDLPPDELAPIRDVLPDGTTVLAPDDVARELPAVGTKVVASPLWAGSAVTDADGRRRAAATFFDLGTTADARLAIADRYGAAAVVLDRRSARPGLLAALQAQGWTSLADGPRVVVLTRPAS